MKLKRLIHYRVNMEKGSVATSAGLMGASFFLLVVYYFGLADLRQLDALTLVLNMILPMVLEAAWFILLRQVKLIHPLVYGTISTALYLLFLVQIAVAGSFLTAIFGAVTLLAAAAAYLVVAHGFIRSRIWAVAAGALALVIRIIVGGLPSFLPEISEICAVVALLALLDAFEPKNT